MEKLLKDLIDTIYMSHQYHCVDYISMFVTLFATVISIAISVFALIESIKNGKRQNEIGDKQNQIALFELRYQVVSILSFIIETIKTTFLYEDTDKPLVLYSAMQTYLSIATGTNQNMYKEETAFYTGLIFEAGKVQYLFKDEEKNILMEFLLESRNYIEEIYMKEYNEERAKKIKELLQNIEDKKIMIKINEYMEI